MVGVKNPLSRRCNSKVFEECPIMHYDEINNKIYCSCCKAASESAYYKKYNQVDSTTFLKGGFIHYQDLGPSLAKNQKSKQHGSDRDCLSRNLLNL